MEEDIQSYFKHDDGIILMQYTGLKDKNGEEVYEGDYIETVEKTISQGDLICRGLVSYERFNACYYLNFNFYDYEKASPLMNFIDLGIEIIGNIYENPKLLEEI